MNGLRLMLVEDEALVALLMESLLQDLGCEVLGPFAGLEAALKWLGGGEAVPDAALLDVNLGGQMVFPLAAALAARDIPFAFVTAYAAVPDPRFAERPLIRKPVSLAGLAAVVAEFKAAA